MTTILMVSPFQLCASKYLASHIIGSREKLAYMLIDTDMHSHVSRSSALQMVLTAQQKGLRVLGLSEHVFQMQETRLALQHLKPEGPLLTFNTYIGDIRAVTYQ